MLQGRAQQCLTKLRQLRDVLKATGDGRIHLDRLLEPWTPAVGEHVRGVYSLLTETYSVSYILAQHIRTLTCAWC